MGQLFSPKIEVPAPPPPPPSPMSEDPEIAAETKRRQNEAKRQQDRALGRSANILSNQGGIQNQGLMGGSSISSKALIG